ncbi:MAG TPA: hypothetical protein VJ850_01590 [Candidatus Limnocylindrales bacterium]|nr:hypothetical protein [Candidatus Limnocylindrales bacterium]
MRRTSLVLIAALAAGCSNPTTSPAPTAGAAAPSGTASCQQAPSVPDNIEGWGPPASAPAINFVPIGPAVATCGENRFLFSFIDAQNRPAGAPDRTARVAFFDLARDKDKPFATADGTFIWAIKDVSGIYALNVAFPEAGRFGAEITTAVNGAPTTLRYTFDVQPSSPLLRVGDKAPSTKTPTLADVGGEPTKISTDATPDPALYQTSIDQALAGHKPLVVIFATPKFCKSATCGPTLDTIKPYVTKYPTVTFINVEPYKLKLVDGTLQADLSATNDLQETATSEAWKLVTEPHVYVVNKDGVITADFELIFSDAELTAALDAVK